MPRMPRDYSQATQRHQKFTTKLPYEYHFDDSNDNEESIFKENRAFQMDQQSTGANTYHTTRQKGEVVKTTETTTVAESQSSNTPTVDPATTVLSTMESPDNPARRGRGRPRKNPGSESPTVSAATVTTAGSPAEEPPAKRGRGRPRKYVEAPVAPVVPTVRRKRGRPKKYDPNAQSSAPAVVVEEEKEVRGRGRPRKLEDEGETTLGSRLA